MLGAHAAESGSMIHARIVQHGMKQFDCDGLCVGHMGCGCCSLHHGQLAGFRPALLRTCQLHYLY